MEKELRELMKVVEDKFEHLQRNKEKHTDGINNEEWYNHKIYLDWVIEELEEAKAELRKNNSVHLEDELWDVLWDYLNLIFFLDKEWYIDHKNVFKRSLKKFSWRLNWIKSWITWWEIKKHQKAELKKEHNLKYIK